MSPEAFGIGQQYWHCFFSRRAFQYAGALAHSVYNKQLNAQSPDYQAVFAAICVMYAQPFSHSTVGKLPESIVPPEHRLLHRDLIDYRNKMVAHIDPAQPRAGADEFPALKFNLDASGNIFDQASLLLPRFIFFENVPELCKILLAEADKKLDELRGKLQPHLPRKAGEYVLNVVDKNDALFRELTNHDGSSAC